jgi:DtxR family Mn-dependent transcriptional regulator
MYSVAEENYIKSIYHLQQHDDNVTTNELADRLRTKPASVTDMLKKLEAKRLLTYQKYYGCRLTNKGRKLALAIIRRHRLWEYFLSEKLGFGWDEVHEIAEQLEHVQSAVLTEKLDAFLGYPQFDPHGDPIPDGEGRMAAPAHIPLPEWPLATAGIISAVAGQQEGLLEILDRKQLGIGTAFTVQQVYAFDGSLDLLLDDGQLVHVSGQLARHLFIKKKEEE